MWAETIEKLLNVRRGEWKSALLMFFYCMNSISAPFVIGKIVSSTLFLKRVEPQYIPYTYIGVAVFTSLALWFYTRISHLFRLDRLIIGSTGILIVITLAFRLAIAETADASSLVVLIVMGGLYVFIQIMGSLCIIQFWIFANHLFSTREAKRLFGLIGTGGVLANMLGGMAVQWFVEDGGVENMLYLVAGNLFACILCVFFLARPGHISFIEETGEPRHPAKAEKETSASKGVFSDIVKSDLLLGIAGIVIITKLVTNITDYQFKMAIRATYDETQLAYFLGGFYMWIGSIASAMQLLFTGRLLQRFGILFAVILLPACLLAASLGILLTPYLFWPVIMLKASDSMFRYSIYDSTFQLFFLPVSPKLRSRAKSAIEGILKPSFTGIAGLMIIGMNYFLDPAQLSYPVSIFLVIWIWLIVRNHKYYISSLADTLHRRKSFSGGTVATEVVDDTQANALVAALKSPDERLVLAIMEVLAESPRINFDEHAAELFSHPSPRVRAAALARLGKRGDSRYAARISGFLSDADEACRAEAITAYCATARESAMPLVKEFLKGRSPLIKRVALAGIFKFCGPGGASLAREELQDMLSSPDPLVREAGAEVLQEIKSGLFIEQLQKLINDPVIEVQTAAIQAAGELKKQIFLPILLDKLRNPKTSRVATEAIWKFGGEICGALSVILSGQDKDKALRLAIPKILSRIGTQDSLDVLFTNLQTNDEDVRLNILKAVNRLLKNSLPSVLAYPKEQLGLLLRKEIENYYTPLLIIKDVGLEAGNTLLYFALHERMEDTMARIFRIMGIIHGETMETIYMNIFSNAPKARANAIELLDNIMGSGPEKKALFALLESADVETKLEAGKTFFNLENRKPAEWLSELMDDKDHEWVRACAVKLAGDLKMAELLPEIMDACGSSRGIIREAAVFALWKIAGLDKLKELAHNRKTSELQNEINEFIRRSEHGKSAMISTLEKVLFLKSIDLFSQIPGQHLTQVAKVAKEAAFEKDETLMEQGEKGDYLYIIVEGEVKILINGKEVARRGKKECLGEMSILDSEPRTATVAAATDVVLLKIDGEDFSDLLSEYGELAKGIIRILKKRLVEAEARSSAK
ncbi:MAG: MFS transporter [Nitrospinae bacterium]|nr:MFS transporter [Nitrospinota bacterium]